MSFRLLSTGMVPGLHSPSRTGRWLTTNTSGNRLWATVSLTALLRHTNISPRESKSKKFSQKSKQIQLIVHYKFKRCINTETLLVFYIFISSRLRENGATALGPAALASVALASKYPGSKVSEE